MVPPLKLHAIVLRMKRSLSLAAMLILMAAPAMAHITASPNSGAAGSFFTTQFTVPHGCDGSPTVAVHISIPPGVTEVNPQAKSGWTVEIKSGKETAQHQSGMTMAGMNVANAKSAAPVSEVIWHGGPLPVDEFDTFGLLMKLPNNPTTLYFRTVQDCQKGSTRYTNTPAAD